ncbi:MAG: hypothetical protein K2M47_02740 [Clostridiales bacterium]|nr:hypothetical protein [Clostridiales bacterium]
MLCKVCGKISAGKNSCPFCGVEHEKRKVNGTPLLVHITDLVADNYDNEYSPHAEYLLQKAQRQSARFQKGTKANRRLTIAALVFGVILLLGGIVSTVTVLCALVRVSVVDKLTGETVIRILVSDGFVGAIVAYESAITVLIPALVMSIVAFVRAKNNNYPSYKLSAVALIITLAGIALALCGGLSSFLCNLEKNVIVEHAAP